MVVRALKILLRVLVVDLVVLVGSGVAVMFSYQTGGHRGVGVAIHAISGYVLVGTAFLAALVAMAAVLPGKDGTSWLTPGAFVNMLAIAVAGVVIAVVGRLMAWDQVAFSGIVKLSRLHGYKVTFHEGARFALIAGREVAIGVVRALFVLHVTLTLLAAVVLVVALKWSVPKVPGPAGHARPPDTSAREWPA
jgi:hypothetical protein